MSECSEVHGSAGIPRESASDEEFVVFCASKDVYEELIRECSFVLKRASDLGRIRLHYATDAPSDLPECDLDIIATQAGLTSRRLGRIIVYTTCVPSTQDILGKMFRGLPTGAVAVASRQTAGRGRHGSTWLTPDGSLAFSMHVTVPSKEPERLVFIQYVAALAAVECIESCPSWSCIPVRIKWPNDIFTDGYKVGGILCEAISQGDRFDVMVGVGINISNQYPTLSLESSRTMNGGSRDKPITRDAFLRAYLNAFESLYNQFENESDFKTLRDRYLASWLHTNQEIALQDFDNRRAVVLGLAPNGCVRAKCLDNGQIVDLSPDVTSLDFAKGVIRDKGRSISRS